MGRPIYCDLDATLIDSGVDGRGNVINIVVRPGVDKFLQKLSKHGDLFLLTHAMRPHVKNAFKAIGAASRLFQGVISREDMEPIIEQVEYLLKDPRLTSEERGMLYQEIQPLAPRGFMFDDQPVGSELYLIKSAAIGSRPSDWIQVKAFNGRSTSGKELERAYDEYRYRAVGPHALMSGRCARVTG